MSSVRTHVRPWLGPANLVTFVRAAITVAVAVLVTLSFAGSGSTTALVTLAPIALVLDGVDGWVARRTGTVTPFGARLDMEVDAALILVLSVAVARGLGLWVLLIGAARYLLLVAGLVAPWLRAPTPPRYWAKVVAATQGVVLTVDASGLLPRIAAEVVTLIALLLLVESFAYQVAWLTGRRPRTMAGPVLSAVAFALVWVALALPEQLGQISPVTFLQIPIEGLVLVALALLVPRRVRPVLAGSVGALLGVLVLLKALDMGYYEELDRPFNPLIESSSLGSGLGVLRDSFGIVWAVLAVIGAVLLTIGFIGGLAWATARAAKVSASNRRATAWVLGVLTIVWAGSAALGVNARAQIPVASRLTTSFAAGEVRGIASAVHDRSVFPEELAANDPYASLPASDLLTSLRGKDVIVAVVESYGQRAVEGSPYAPGVDAVLDQSTKELQKAGYASESGFLTSPTFGGLSWLAHSTFQSGSWIDNQQRYNELLDSNRFTLSAAFAKAGWHTVSDAPADEQPWPQGQRFYHFEQMLDGTNTGYAGPTFSYGPIPDQYTLKAFNQLVLAPGHQPVMAELDLVSSHYPWDPLPHLVPWTAIGNGSIYDPMPAQQPTVPQLYQNYDNVRAAYGKSIQYTTQSLVSFVQNAHDKSLVLILFGDHQPAPKVSLTGATHDVPISIVASDPSVFTHIASWGWTPGLRPATDAPVWPMDAFRNRLFQAFDRTAPTVAASGAQH